MGTPYFPGCTLSTKAAGYDHSGRAVAAALGLALDEIDGWQCCGATFPLAADNSMALVAPTRVLAQAELAGDTVTALCAICYHVLKRTQVALDRDPAMLERINWFTEKPYHGGVRVVHLLELLRDVLTWEGLRVQVRRPLAGLRVAPYYGCLLLRPAKEIGLDDPERPTILHDCIAALGAEPVDFPYAVECCGSYLAVNKADVPGALARKIIASARANGADLIVTACPLCQFNLDFPQRRLTSPPKSPSPYDGEGDLKSLRPSDSFSPFMERGADRWSAEGGEVNPVPILYFTQLMAVALDLPQADWGLEGLYVDPMPVLESILAREEAGA